MATIKSNLGEAANNTSLQVSSDKTFSSAGNIWDQVHGEEMVTQNLPAMLLLITQETLRHLLGPWEPCGLWLENTVAGQAALCFHPVACTYLLAK